MVDEQTEMLLMVKADGLKQQGNEKFTQGQYQDALSLYQEAINVCPTNAIYYSNASACCSHLGEYGNAAVYATEALRLDPTMAKGYYRRATAMMGLKEWKAALEDLRRLVAGRTASDIRTDQPVSADIQSRIQLCEKELQKIAFAKAIHVDVMELDMKHIKAIEVDPSYEGPRLADNEPVTWDFVERLISWFKAEKRLHPRYAYRLMYEALVVVQSAPNVVHIKTPPKGLLTVCGDVHGQLFDFIQIFEMNGYPSLNHTYVFNGDLVDRGAYSTEIILLAFALKAAFPANFYIARGNHETETVNRMHGFYEEITRKYSGESRIFTLANQVLHALPLAHLIDEAHFVVHGGLPANGATLTIDEIQKINRRAVPEPHSLMANLLWSDPQDAPGIGPSERGEGVLFGPDVTASFLAQNGLKTLIRSHVWEPTGYRIHHGGKCITIFSAPNYTDSTSPAALINVRPGLELEFKTFEAAPYRGKAVKPRPLSGLPFY